MSRHSWTFFLKLITSIWHHKLNITVSDFYVIIIFYVQNVHRWPIHKSAVTCCSLSLQWYQWISAARQTRSVAVCVSTSKFFWFWLQLMVRDCSIAPKRDNLVDGDQVNWGGGTLILGNKVGAVWLQSVVCDAWCVSRSAVWLEDETIQ